uniref:TATA-box binding protein associated factor 4 n=1 Tax=Takifugu rubripes TaxID=31033 RepID=H2RT50_TAKRU
MDDGAAGIAAAAAAAEPSVTAVQEQPKTGAAGGVITVATEAKNKSGPNGVQTVNGSAVPMNCHLTGGASVDTGGDSAQPAASVNNGPASGPGAAAASATSIIRTASPNNVTPAQRTVPTVTLVRPPVPKPSSSSPASPAACSSSGSVPDKVEGTKPIIQAVAPAATATITSPTVLQNLRTPAPSTIAISTGGGVRPLGQQMVAPRLAQPQQTTTSVQNIQLPPGMVLVRSESGQLLMFHQQTLAQMKAQSQSQSAITPRLSAPASTPPVQVASLQAPAASLLNRAVAPATIIKQVSTVYTTVAGTTTLQRPPVLQNAIMLGGTVAAPGQPLGTATTVQPGASVPQRVTGTSATPTAFTAETLENVKKCRSFLSTLIKLTSNGKQSSETTANVKELIKKLLEAKIEAEDFTSRLYRELSSSPQPYLVPFLKRSLPALRQMTPDSEAFIQQSLLPQTNTPAAAASTALAAVVLRPPLSTAAPTSTSTSTSTALTKATVISLSQAPHSKPTLVILHLYLAASLSFMSPPSLRDDDDINDVASMAGVNLTEESANILATNSELVGTVTRSCKDETFLSPSLLGHRALEIGKRFGVGELGADVVRYISHAAQQRLQDLLEKVSHVAQLRSHILKEDGRHEQVSDVRAQLKFFEQLDQLERQRKEEQEREILLKAAKSRSRQEDPEQLRLKQKAKEMQQQELAQIRHREANLTALAAIGPRKKRKTDAPVRGASGSGWGPPPQPGGSSGSGSRQFMRQRITRVNVRDLLFCLENERGTNRSQLLYKGFLK